jgi:hypothetical protein
MMLVGADRKVSYEVHVCARALPHLIQPDKAWPDRKKQLHGEKRDRRD